MPHFLAASSEDFYQRTPGRIDLYLSELRSPLAAEFFGERRIFSRICPDTRLGATSRDQIDVQTTESPPGDGPLFRTRQADPGNGDYFRMEWCGLFCDSQRRSVTPGETADGYSQPADWHQEIG